MAKTNTNSRVPPTVFARNVQTLSKCWTQRFSGKMYQIAGLHIHVHILYIYSTHLYVLHCAMSQCLLGFESDSTVCEDTVKSRSAGFTRATSDSHCPVLRCNKLWKLMDLGAGLISSIVGSFVYKFWGDRGPFFQIPHVESILKQCGSQVSGLLLHVKSFQAHMSETKKHMPCWWVLPKSNRCACCGCCCFCYICVFLLDEYCGICMLFAWYCSCHAFLPFHREDM